MDISICITAYNLEKYIQECLESVLSQEFSGSFEIVIVNDNSSDKTEEIILHIQKTHPKGNLIRYFKNTPNIGYVENTLVSFERATGKYIAVLDGDDYFIDPKKLQKQFDFLENHPDFTAVSGDSLVIYEDSGISSHSFSAHKGMELGKENLTDPMISQTSTLFFRKEMLRDDFPTQILSADRCLYLLAGCFGKLKVLEDQLSAYRQFSLSLSKNVAYDRLKLDFNIIPFIKKYNPEYRTSSLKRYFYYTLMSYSNKMTKMQFYQAAAGYSFYNMQEKVTENPQSVYATLKWTIKTIQRKYQYKKQNHSFVSS